MELARFPSHGGFSVRSILKFALAAFTTVFLWVLLAGTPVHAADASWTGDSVIYNDHVYNLIDSAEHPSGIASDAKAYKYQPVATTSDPEANKKAYFIYFASGVDPPEATTAQYVVYDYNSTSKTYSNPQDAASISVTPKSEQGTNTSCAIDGIGWIVCPVTMFMADSMDVLFDLISNFLTVQPILSTDRDNGLYTAWNIARNIANIAFLIGFLIIIYSQLTNYGVSNYGIKRLLPRLILAAILMNLSFIIVAAAIDISNILGYSIQNVFEYIRADVFHVSADTWGSGLTSGWAELTSKVLAGAGTIGGAFVLWKGASYLLIPVVLILTLTLLFVLIVLAARQAIIIILVVIAPLAFIANLLPNTEKWFDKWRDLFMTMLIFFPAFSLAFGGAQLAGQIIIMNAGDNIIMVIFGMAVQIAPLVITPLILKLSGGLLGRIAQIANNPNKGLIDRNKKWAQDRADLRRNSIAGRDLSGRSKYNPLTYGTRAVKGGEFRRRRLADKLENAKLDATNRYEETDKYGKLHEHKAGSEQIRDTNHNEHAKHIEALKLQKGSRIQQTSAALEASKAGLEKSQKKTERYYNTVKRNEAFANRMGASAVYQAAYGLEDEKQRLETSQNRLNEYYTDEKTVTGTKLEKSAVRLETSKQRVEASQGRYNARIEDLKVTAVGSGLQKATVSAASSKEHLEGAQQRLQAYFDTQRKDKRTELGQSTIVLENSKGLAEQAKADLTTYLTQERVSGVLKSQTLKVEDAKQVQQGAEAKLAEFLSEQRSNGVLRTNAITTERSKQAQQNAELEFNRLVEQFKSGGVRTQDANGNEIISINGAALSATEQALAREMYTLTEDISAETQGIEAAKNEARQRVSTVLAEETTARAQELLNIAGSNDENGQQRALANALAQRSKSRAETLSNIKSIIGFRNFSTAQIRTLAEGGEIDGIKNTHDVTAAAIQMTFSGKDAGQLEKALENIDWGFPDATDEEREELYILAGEALESNPSRPPFMSAGVVANLKQGRRFNSTEDNIVPLSRKYGEGGVNEMILANINAGKLDSKKLQSAGKDYVEPIMRAVLSNPSAINPEQVDRLMKSLSQTLDPRRESSEGLADSRPFLEKIFREYGGTITNQGIPIMPDGSVPEEQNGDNLS